MDLNQTLASFRFTHAGGDHYPREWMVTRELDEHALRGGVNVTISCVAIPRLRMSARLMAMPDGTYTVDKCFPERHELWLPIGADGVGAAAGRALIDGLGLRLYE